MTVVPPSDHLFVIFIFDDAVFSHGRSGSVSGNVIDAIINIIVIIVFFFLFSVDIKAVYKFIIESLFKITKMFELLFRKKTKSLIHPCLSEFFIGNKSSSFYFFWYQKLLHKQGSGYGDSISNLCQKYVKSKQNRKRFCFCYFYKSRGICFFNKELFLFDFSVLCIIKNTGKGVSGSDKKKIQKGSVFNKITS